jgi:glycosyltransferase involved in cell wall biosynthesis
MFSPEVSVVMPVRDGAAHIREAVGSLIAQTLRDWELIAVLDGSRDASRDVLCDFDDPRIRLIELESSVGVAKALNVGLRACRAPLVARIDADDVCRQDRFAKQVETMAFDEQLVVLGSSALLIDGEGRSLGVRRVPLWPEQVRRRLRWRNALIHPSVMYRRDVIQMLGGYDPRCLLVEDYELWLRVMAVGELASLEAPLISYRIHGSQVSGARTFRRKPLRIISASRCAAAVARGESRAGAYLRQAVWASAQARRELVRRH